MSNSPSSMADLRAAPFNPRRIDDPAKAALRKSLKVFGDLAGFVVNTTSGHIVCGHQRRDQLVHLNVSAIEWSEPYEVELGEDGKRFVSVERDGWTTMPGGARFRVRLVDWPEPFEKAANITANSPTLAGVFTEDLGPLRRSFRPSCRTSCDLLHFDELLAEVSVVDTAGEVSEGPEPKLDQADELRKVWGVEPGQLWVIPSKTRRGRVPSPACRRQHRGRGRAARDGRQAGRAVRDRSAVPGRLRRHEPPLEEGRLEVGRRDGRRERRPRALGAGQEQGLVGHLPRPRQRDDPVQGEALYDGFVAMAVEHAVTERAAWYCWHASRHQAMLERVWTKYGAFVHQQIIWAKNRGHPDPLLVPLGARGLLHGLGPPEQAEALLVRLPDARLVVPHRRRLRRHAAPHLEAHRGLRHPHAPAHRAGRHLLRAVQRIRQPARRRRAARAPGLRHREAPEVRRRRAAAPRGHGPRPGEGVMKKHNETEPAGPA